MDILVKIPGIDFNVKRKDGETLAQAAVEKGDVRSVETLANQEEFDCWNVPDKNGDTPVMMARESGRTDMVKILVGCPRVDLTIRDKEGWTLLMRTIAAKELGERMMLTSSDTFDYIEYLDLVKRSAKKLRGNITGHTLARIAVEVCQEEDVERLVESRTVDWNQRAEGEDPAVFWALNNERLEMVKILLKCSHLDLSLRDKRNQKLETIAR